MLELRYNKTNLDRVREQVSAKEISTKHFCGQLKSLRKTHAARRKPGPKRLNSSQAKKVKEELGNICLLCGTGSTWNGFPLTLQIDHINGIATDNHISNLRVLCPNCHSQTATHSGKNRKRLKHFREIGLIEGIQEARENEMYVL